MYVPRIAGVNVFLKEPCISSKEPHIFSKEAYILRYDKAQVSRPF